MVVNGHGDGFFGTVLADDVLVEEFDDLAGLFHVFVLDEATHGPLLIRLVEAGQDGVGRSDAVFADDGAAASDEALAGRLGFAAEQALRFSFCHFRLLSILCLPLGGAARLRGLAPRFAGLCFGRPRAADVDDS